MKVLDVEALHKGIDATIEKLISLQDQMKQVENDVKGLVALDDSFKGEGGQAIRSYYQESHEPFLAFSQEFFTHYQNTLKTMKSNLYSLEPASNGLIRQSFLENELEQGLQRTKESTIGLTNEANAVMNSVKDIISLPRLDDGEFLQGVIQAQSHRN